MPATATKKFQPTAVKPESYSLYRYVKATYQQVCHVLGQPRTPERGRRGNIRAEWYGKLKTGSASVQVWDFNMEGPLKNCTKWNCWASDIKTLDMLQEALESAPGGLPKDKLVRRANSKPKTKAKTAHKAAAKKKTTRKKTTARR